MKYTIIIWFDNVCGLSILKSHAFLYRLLHNDGLYTLSNYIIIIYSISYLIILQSY